MVVAHSGGLVALAASVADPIVMKAPARIEIMTTLLTYRMSDLSEF